VRVGPASSGSTPARVAIMRSLSPREIKGRQLLDNALRFVVGVPPEILHESFVVVLQEQGR
jgi:hypothetical protein